MVFSPNLLWKIKHLKLKVRREVGLQGTLLTRSMAIFWVVLPLA